jgi:phosphoribosylformylglycinamidine synthase
MRVTGAGNPLTPFSQTLAGKLPQKKICQIAARGYSSYGNQIGLATGQVAEIYHPGYVAKRLEIGAVVAAAPRSQVVRGTPAAGDVILLIGGRTGRDGVGGATGSSKEHTDTALENSAEVQKGDAPTERKIQRLFRNPQLTRKIKVCNDFGAGGVSVAIGEIAPSLEINLDAIQKKYDGLDGTELAISESQERMAVCIDPADIDFFIHYRPPRDDLARPDHRQPLPRLPRHQRRPTIRLGPCGWSIFPQTIPGASRSDPLDTQLTIPT